jgi:NitT/TauT family transport system permease protein
MKRRPGRNVFSPFLPPAALGFAALSLTQLQVTHWAFHLKTLQLPLPLDVAAAFLGNIGDICENAAVTLAPVLGGMLAGALIGYGVAAFVTAFPFAGRGSLFLMTALNSIPVIALAPIMNRWFAAAFAAKLAVVTVISMGAMAVNAYMGLRDVEGNALDLMRSCGAPLRKVFWKLRIPASLPAVFTALKINVAAAMMGIIISEYFASETAGVGYMIKYSLKVGNQKAAGWAYITAAAILSLIIYALIALLQRRLLAWHVSSRLEN